MNAVQLHVAVAREANRDHLYSTTRAREARSEGLREAWSEAAASAYIVRQNAMNLARAMKRRGAR